MVYRGQGAEISPVHILSFRAVFAFFQYREELDKDIFPENSPQKANTFILKNVDTIAVINTTIYAPD